MATQTVSTERSDHLLFLADKTKSCEGDLGTFPAMFVAPKTGTFLNFFSTTNKFTIATLINVQFYWSVVLQKYTELTIILALRLSMNIVESMSITQPFWELSGLHKHCTSGHLHKGFNHSSEIIKHNMLRNMLKQALSSLSLSSEPLRLKYTTLDEYQHAFSIINKHTCAVCAEKCIIRAL